MGNVGGGKVCVGGGGRVCVNSVLAIQFCCKHKTALKNKLY